ncbi:hypothetical protein DXB27_22615 [Parabacteroides gordonii]|nr:hypothetical protein DXB27_22615 [Parabacteroides gordonii]
MKKSCYNDRGFQNISVIQIKIKNKTDMKYILFIAMDLAVYPFLLLLFIAKSIFSKIQPTH